MYLEYQQMHESHRGANKVQGICVQVSVIEACVEHNITG